MTTSCIYFLICAFKVFVPDPPTPNYWGAGGGGMRVGGLQRPSLFFCFYLALGITISNMILFRFKKKNSNNKCTKNEIIGIVDRSYLKLMLLGKSMKTEIFNLPINKLYSLFLLTQED